MAASEESRHHLYNKLEVVLGSEDAAVLMEHLPPVGWADVATKRDLDALESRLNERFDARLDARFGAVDSQFGAVDSRFDAIDSRFETMQSRFDSKLEQELRLMTWRVLVVMVAAMSVLVAVTRLAG